MLPCHTSEPVHFDQAPLTSSLREVVEEVSALAMNEEDFVAWILGRLPPAPANYEHIVRFNEAGSFPALDPTLLEAGANRCAI